MSNIDWSEAPGLANIHVSGSMPNWWMKLSNGEFTYWNGADWVWTKVDPLKVRNLDVITLRKQDFQPFTSIEDAQPYTRDDAIKFLIENIKNFPSNDDSQPVCNGWKWIHVYGPMMAFSNGVKAEAIFETDFNRAKKIYRDSLRTGDDAQPAPDMVNHPPHYQSDNGIECIDAIRAALGRDGFISYCVGNSMKYQWSEKADKLEDMRKAAWYLNRAIEEQSK